MLSQSLYHLLSSYPGVYLFENQKGEVIYVGKAKNLKKRVSSYFNNPKKLGEKTRRLVSETAKVKSVKVESEIESLLLEANLIQKYKPKYNVKLADSKRYPLIEITLGDKYPKVLIVRRESNKKSRYFGPYPNVGDMRNVLKIARRIFPFQSVLNHPKKACFYHHLNLCPCPEVFLNNNYRKNINHLVNFLSGHTKKVIADLKRELKNFVKDEEYEKAGETQKKIETINLITSPYFKPLEYEENPNLRSDVRDMELKNLQIILNSNGVSAKYPRKIECFDISNVSGKNATGSLIVFLNGERYSPSYRRFKIRYTDSPNDFAMMKELVNRRFNHEEWEFPDLILIDGGKGQVSSSMKVLEEKGLTIPLIGLAKKEETIITSDFKEISLPKESNALKLLQRIRDEAHRFAITYHRKLRSKSLFGDNVVVRKK